MSKLQKNQRKRHIRDMRTMIIGMIIMIMEGAAYAADPAIKTNLSKTKLNSSESFSLTYYLLNSRGQRISSPTGTVTLNSYTDASCSAGQSQVGSSIELATTKTGSYSFLSPGTFYLKPSLTGYTGNCLGPVTVLGTTNTSADGTTQPLVFQKLSLSKSPGSSGNVNISLSWLNNSDLLVTTATSSNKATFFLSQSQSCSSRISGSRLLSYSPKFGQASFSTSLPNVTPVFGCAYAYSGQTKITAQSIELKSSCSPPQTLINGLCSSCPSGTSLISGKCVTTTKSCEANNGFGTSTVDLSTMNWGDCILSSCSAGYHLVPENNTCEANSRECSITDGVGSQTWDPILSSWGSCIVSSCDSGFHLEGNECSWNQEQCSNPVCVTTVRYGISRTTCYRGPLGTRRWSNGAWGACVEYMNADCADPYTGDPLSGYHLENGICVLDMQNCTVHFPSITNIKIDNRFQPKRSGTATGKKYWNHSTGNYGSCVIESCPEYSHLEGGICRGNYKNARREGFLGLAGCFLDIWNGSNKSYVKFNVSAHYNLMLGENSDGETVSTSCPLPIN